QSHAAHVPKMVSYTRDLQPTTLGGYRQVSELVKDMWSFIETHVRELDVPPPPKASAPPNEREVQLLAAIVADPSDLALRLEYARHAEQRNDAVAQLIRLQLRPAGDGDRRQARDLVHAHPEWTAPLIQLGARDIQFAGGFPDEITVDA